jgi:hypothetical protein
VHGLDYRSFQRDLQHLRKIGEEAGCKISAISGRERAELVNVDWELRSLDASPRVLALISALGGALGAPVSGELGGLGEGSADAGFLRFILPQLVGQTRVAETYERLKAAWEVRPGPAVVKFEYDRGRGARMVCRVEP